MATYKRAELKEFSDDEFEKRLTELYGTVSICGMEFDSGRALRELDPTAFNCAMADEPEIWTCNECRKEYETADEAENCCDFLD